jgi:hypothetical protein
MGTKGIAQYHTLDFQKVLYPELEPDDRKTAEIEGWIFGVV